MEGFELAARDEEEEGEDARLIFAARGRGGKEDEGEETDTCLSSLRTEQTALFLLHLRTRRRRQLRAASSCGLWAREEDSTVLVIRGRACYARARRP